MISRQTVSMIIIIVNCITIWVCQAKIVVRFLTHSALPFASCTMCQSPDYYFGIAHSNCVILLYKDCLNMSVHQRFSLMYYIEIFITGKVSSQLDKMNRGKSVWAKWKWGACVQKIFNVITGIKLMYEKFHDQQKTNS